MEKKKENHIYSDLTMTTYENERYERSDSMCAAHPGQTKSDVSHTDLQSECICTYMDKLNPLHLSSNMPIPLYATL